MRGNAGLNNFAIELTAPIVRIGSKNWEPMTAPPRSLQGIGRFDDPMIDTEPDPGGYSVLYAAVDAKAAYLEVLYRFRTPVARIKEIANELVLDMSERDQLLAESGFVPKNWLRNSAVMQSRVALNAPVLDLANPSALQSVRQRLAGLLFQLDVDDLDFGVVLGANRLVTQTLSRWIWSLTNDHGQPLFSGIRYRSRFDPECICLALYQDRYEVDGDIDSQPITPETPGFAAAAKTLRLKIS